MHRRYRATRWWLLALAGIAACDGCGGGSVTPHDGGRDGSSDTTPANACPGTWTRATIAAGAPKPPGLWDAAMAPDPDQGEVLLFGGILAEPLGRSNQAWSWNGTTGTWTNRTPSPLPASWPPALAQHRMTWDPVRHRILMFGGSTTDNIATDELWEWNGAAGTWTNLTPAQRPTAWPVARISPAMTYDAGRGRLIVASGYTPYGPMGVGEDTWEWDSAASTWTDRTPDPLPAAWFEPRQFPLGGIDPSSGRPVLFGGFSGGGSLQNEMWEWNASSATWTDLTPSPLPASWPPGGGWSVLAAEPCPGRLIAVGADLALNDVLPLDTPQVWQWDGSAGTWTDLTALSGGGPPAGQVPAAATDPATKRIVFFGGQPRPGNVPNDETWTWGAAL